MKKSAYYSDLIFTFSFLSFCALFCLRFFDVPLAFSLILSFVFGFAAAYLLSVHIKKREKVFALKKSEETEKNSLCFYLSLCDDKELTEFLRPRLPFLLSAVDGEKILDSNEQQTTDEKTEELPLRLSNYSFFPCFRFQELTADDIAKEYQKLKGEISPVILCDKLSDDGKSLCEKLSVPIVDGNLLYRAFKDHSAIPDEFPIQTTTPIKRKLRNISFAKSNSKRFFLSGVLLVISSVFIPYPIYYLIFGSLLLITAVLVRIFGYR